MLKQLVITATAVGVTATVSALTSVAFATTGETGSDGSAAVTAHTSADTPAAPYLPKPTGTQPVGTTSPYLKDTSRPDLWVAEANARELMVSLWYPAKSTGKRRAHYMTPMESELLLKDGGITSVPYDTFSKTRTNAFTTTNRPARNVPCR